MQDLRDGIISRPIWAVGKLKRVQSSRNGGANVVLYRDRPIYRFTDIFPDI